MKITTKILNLLRNIFIQVRLRYGIFVEDIAAYIYRRLMIHGLRMNPMHYPAEGIGLTKTTLDIYKTDREATTPIKLKYVLDNMPKEARTALDIGCYNGYYSLALAKRDIFTIGCEPQARLLKIAQLSGYEKMDLPVAFSGIGINLENVNRLPLVDVSLVLSVMHNWVVSHGWDGAIQILDAIWSKTKYCMFFEMPNPVQNNTRANTLKEMGVTDDECKVFIDKMLDSLDCSEVTFLDYMYTDFRGDEKRHLFKVVREK